MEFIFGIFIFTLGVIIGSFLNVVALRYGSGRGVKGRSFCFSCGKTLKAFELIPLLSFIFQKGKCRGCESKISIQYPLVEALTGFVFLLTYVHQVAVGGSVLSFLYTVFVFCILIVIAVYDVKHKIIPDGLVFTFIALGIVKIFLLTPVSMLFSFPTIFNTLAPILLFLPFFFLWALSRGQWMGFGDAKLAIGIGAFLGLSAGLSAVIIGFWSGALWSLFMLALQKRHRRKGGSKLSFSSEIPFAPFLIFGVFIAFLFKPDFFLIQVLLFN